MPALDNPKHEAVAREYVALLEDKTQRPSLTKAYQNVYGAPYESAHAHASRVANGGVKNRIQEILEQRGLTQEALLEYGDTQFLRCEDKNIGFKAWRTFLELQGMINQEQGVNIANIVFNEQIVQPAPQQYDESARQPSTSDNIQA